MNSKALIEVWRKNAKKEIGATDSIIKGLKKSKKNDLRKLSKKADEEVFKELNCLDCGNCCKSLPTIFTDSDIKRISSHLNLNEQNFRKKYLLKDEDEDLVNKKQPCIFLNTQNRCEIYDVRPQACRDYPITGETLFADNMDLHLTNSIYCPAVYHILRKIEEIMDQY